MASSITPQPSDPRSGEDEAEEQAPAADLEKVFKRFDSNGDGKISSSELASVMDALGSATAEEEIRRMMEEMDTDRDGYVDFNEFARFHKGGSSSAASAGQAPGSTNIDDLREAFHIYDLDNNGLISATELHKVLQKLGDTCSVPDCVRMIASLDSDGDGNINFNEFLNMMNATTTTDK